VVNAVFPAAVVGGNLETAQRMVDVILGAFSRIAPERTIAACQGTMNNVAIGGIDPRSGRPYTLYETIGGGFGARPTADGVDGVHSHMTNTLNTPVESLELAYPLRVERYELIAGTGGRGRFRGASGSVVTSPRSTTRPRSPSSRTGAEATPTVSPEGSPGAAARTSSFATARNPSFPPKEPFRSPPGRRSACGVQEKAATATRRRGTRRRSSATGTREGSRKGTADRV
jgi:N-methylhydantoinase B/oxoprolinase/acetone carboxylase alpha subunit